jgi:hypothetical protein
MFLPGVTGPLPIPGDTLRPRGYDATGIFDQGPVPLLCFNDPDDNMLEATRWLLSSTQP